MSYQWCNTDATSDVVLVSQKWFEDLFTASSYSPKAAFPLNTQHHKLFVMVKKQQTTVYNIEIAQKGLELGLLAECTSKFNYVHWATVAFHGSLFNSNSFYEECMVVPFM